MLLRIVIFSLCVLQLHAQPLSPWRCRPGDRFRSYVVCDGQKVEALYYLRKDKASVGLGCEDYSVTAIDTALAGSIVVPPSVAAPDGQMLPVTSVSRHALADCRRITEVVLPGCIKDIGDQSFMNCRSLRSIILPSRTSFIWPYAFRGCHNLRRVEVRASVPPDSYNDVFDKHTLRFATLVVPAEHARAYRNAFVWNMFRYIVADWDRH